jgi:hypothetical protein
MKAACASCVFAAALGPKLYCIALLVRLHIQNSQHSTVAVDMYEVPLDGGVSNSLVLIWEHDQLGASSENGQ